MTKKERLLEDAEIRKNFPLIRDDEAYLDNAATTQKPQCVIDAVNEYYQKHNANPLRGLYGLSIAATDDYEDAREAVREFINAGSTEEIIFTRNASESLNLVGYAWTADHLQPGDEVVVTIMEHHSNMLPWQQACKRTGAVIRYIEPDKTGLITEEVFRAAITPKTKLVCMTQVSNVLGRENPIKRFAQIAHEAGAVFVCDGAQSVPHMPVDVQDLDVDFLAFSGHKMLAPMGIGVLYGKREILDKMQPFLFGGEMIEYVTLEGATYAELPHKFEAGTVNAGGAVGLHAAIDFYKKIGWDRIVEREEHLTAYAMEKMKELPYVHIIGSEKPEEHHGILTFKVDGVHPHDIAAILDSCHIDVRAGHHCAQPLMKYLNTLSTSRASLCFYNTEAEVDRLIEALKTVRKDMGYAE
ncbi:MAG: cysteine desulfurase [Eubacterium sp.]|uniref:Cysteine desulfurase n=1 Tax=Eubacterium cellulosolvens (strain ATCC 43171 / JCM 9499 / 6) TaxID=633697 RepID=I5AUK2_EUBC6|nr:cysteine desulfurase [Eubacterium sp.]